MSQETLEGQLLIDHCARELFAKKAENVSLLNLIGLSDVADYYLVATCASEPQMRAILNGLQRSLKGTNVKLLGIDYKEGDRWAVADFGEIMVHLFEEEERMNLSLDKLWSESTSSLLDAADYPLEEELDEESGDEYI
jgi:ribosome-associated protein